MRVLLSLSFALSLWLTSYLTQVQSSWILSSDFLRLWWARSVVVGEYLYIVGGEQSSLVNGQAAYGAFNQTLAIPLSTSWSNSSVQIGASNLPSSFPRMKTPTLWLDESSDVIWFFNGETSSLYPTNAYPLSIWAFSPDNTGGGTWKENNSASDNVFNNLTRRNECGSAYSPTAGYSLGGYASSYTTPTYDGSRLALALGGMQKFDFADKTWSNVSSTGSSASGWNIGPVFQYVPAYGRSGIIVLVGGVTPTHQNNADNSEGQEPFRPMSNVTIYDIYSQQWFSQTASGDVPGQRVLPCFVGAQGGDNSTYEIFVFGGSNGVTDSTNADSHQVYVLSLPAFRWFRTTANTAARFGHTCNVVGKRQMLTFGGLDPTIPQNNGAVADPFTYGLGIFDMTAWNWSSSYFADAAPYEPAPQVSQFYSANSKYPSWDNPALQALFEENATTRMTSPTPTPTSFPSSTTPPSNSSSTPAGAIAGGVVGSLAFLVLVGAVVWFIMRRLKRYRADASPRTPTAEIPPEPKRAELTQPTAELGTDVRHELGPGFVEERPSEMAAW